MPLARRGDQLNRGFGTSRMLPASWNCGRVAGQKSHARICRFIVLEDPDLFQEILNEHNDQDPISPI